MRAMRIVVLGLLALAALVVGRASTGAVPGSTERVSVDSTGNQGNGDSAWAAISGDGRYVAFGSWASNLVLGDSLGTHDVFVRDRQTGVTALVSVDSVGNPGNQHSFYPAISGDERFVAFESLASNLVTDDTNGVRDVFVHDRQTATTERVSMDSAGNQANSHSYWAAISSDGRYVAFTSAASNLVPGDTNGKSDVFVHDRQTGVTERVSVDSSGNQGNDGNYDSAISGDGRYVAFTSVTSNLVPGDTNGEMDVFVHDRQTGVTERVSVDSAGNQGNSHSFDAAISGDGRYVAFASFASNLVTGDTNDHDDVFVHDWQTGVTERVSVDSSGNQDNGRSWQSAISADGRHVAFASEATNLVTGDTNSVTDIFVHDRQTGATERASVDSAGNEGNSDSFEAAISGDGRYVAFQSEATNLVPGDTNGHEDIFVHDRGSTPPTPTPTPTPAPVGGIAEYPDVAAPAGGSGPSVEHYALLAGLASVALVALTAGAWRGRRRWLR